MLEQSNGQDRVFGLGGDAVRACRMARAAPLGAMMMQIMGAQTLEARYEALVAERDDLRRQLAEARRVNPSEDAQFLRSLLGALPAFVVRADPSLRIRYINRLVSGMSEEEALQGSMYDFIAPEYRELAGQKVALAASSGVPQRYRVVGRGDNGQPAHYETIVVPINEVDGNKGMIFLAFDVTEATERERALEHSQENLRITVEGTGIGLWSWDAIENTTVWSERMKEIMGRSEPLGPQQYLAAVHPNDVERAKEALERVLGGDKDGWVSHRIVTPAGETRWILPCGRMSRDEQGRVTRVVGGNLDITSTRALERRLRQAEKMQAIGTLTAGVAHNVNNMLAVVLPLLDVLGEHVDEEGKSLLAEALQAGQGAADVVRQLMTFAGRRQGATPKPVRVGDAVRAAVDLSQRALASSMTLSFELGPPGLSVQCDGGELQQALVNLIANARDALEGASLDRAPRIEIRVDVPSVLPEALLGKGPRSGYARVTVADNGPGIAPEVQRRVFDPFFTTKGPSNGTGLGLATAWAVVSSSGGTIECESDLGEGARFSIYLPMVQAPFVEASKKAVVVDANSNGLRVLLVEDNDQVRRVISRVLTRGQHAVTCAMTVAEAVDVAGTEPIDVILLDQSLPDQRGLAAVPGLRLRAPNATIFLFTGEDVDDASLSQVDGLIPKPVTGSVLLGALSRVAPRR